MLFTGQVGPQLMFRLNFFTKSTLRKLHLSHIVVFCYIDRPLVQDNFFDFDVFIQFIISSLVLCLMNLITFRSTILTIYQLVKPHCHSDAMQIMVSLTNEKLNVIFHFNPFPVKWTLLSFRSIQIMVSLAKERFNTIYHFNPFPVN